MISTGRKYSIIISSLIMILLIGQACTTTGNLSSTASPVYTPTQTSTNTPIPSPTNTPTPLLGIGTTQTRRVDGMIMLYVPEGDFNMGSDTVTSANAEMPVHTVYVDAFWIDQTEVTNVMYAQCVQDRACDPPEITSSFTHDSYYDSALYSDYPVIYVSWLAANAYCEWAGARLPTEAEWEKAARGENGYVYPWGNDFYSNNANANLCDLNCAFDPMNWRNTSLNDGYSEISPVGSFPSGASPYGALDMAGNVFEWVSDWYDKNYYSSSPSNNPQGSSTGEKRVLRGGAWDISDLGLRTSFRTSAIPEKSYYDTGFRCSISP